MRTYDAQTLKRLNSATQYPSIETYHELGERGILQESGNPFAGLDEMVFISEKIDGANARIILWGDDWFIGSRTELLTARGDRVWPERHGIVDALLPHAERAFQKFSGNADGGEIIVIYVEVFGHSSLPNSSIYGTRKQTGARMFDIAFVDPAILDWEPEAIAAWRDRDMNRFSTIDALAIASLMTSDIPLVPILHGEKADELPATIGGMADLLEEVAPFTKAHLVDGHRPQRPEGIVLRTANRTVIRKARYESYDRTLRLAQHG